ncbi:hypothetical protein [Fischerella sp. PCC 9605]|uniref:hypothetical protein n=1 Tax=Fischerella sp. PCC 9605 TaxID=1173024 RepID=UPI0004B80456|nr:hypothetical protein [Fischerella sp. PCC 9605]
MKLKLMSVLFGAAMFAMAIPVAAQACPGKGQNQQQTPQQQSQLEQTQRNTLQEVSAVLTPEQQQQFQNALNQGQGIRSALASLNLSEEQQTQLQAIMESSKT